ncbi:hypothetical protein [Parvicella tangerina]|uniref:Uncharacterized protein n=1 Tax=Parvicella tangerina TaxID=2829795 RepID=A0A916JR70_9FLAO|nr:hypothetical protein [Parvicella tangerina]CAG5087428.1 hypothetical protein CRYO30217_03480 [Parvicella tangerina]
MTATKQYLKRFFEEKQIPNVNYQIEDSEGFTHLFDNTTLIDRILHTCEAEQKQIANVLRQIDFKNGSVQHFLNYLAEAMVKQWRQAA